MKRTILNPVLINKRAEKIRGLFPNSKPSAIKNGPVFGFGYRPPWLYGNIIQAETAKKYKLNAIIAQQSAREIERTQRSFREVVDCGAISAYQAGLDIPWGADGDHLRNEKELEDAIGAGCTHFTIDVSAELKKGLDEVASKVKRFCRRLDESKQGGGYTTEISLDETEKETPLEDIARLVENLAKDKIRADEIAPRFPGYFEKAVDYYYRREAGGRKIRDTEEFEKYLENTAKAGREMNFRISVHSGSDKFSVYPLLAKALGSNMHLKTAGTYYLEELKIVARRNTELFREIYNFSLKQFMNDRATYELSADSGKLPDMAKLNGKKISKLMESGTGSDDLRQVLHVTYGSVLTARNSRGVLVFSGRIARVLEENREEYSKEFRKHLLRHIKDFVKTKE